ncbi:PREDICTED: nesprin-2-like isoform X6 [Poecilia mexicana]|uniref:nesprin-2-like isoform X6 n=1 Tax=Poecilia mexicana TaxID=48701 RepID=UPI00072DFDAC|nr:PREDICTED: nesprin-2-like isoform X6 [Poecilia mexicana]
MASGSEGGDGGIPLDIDNVHMLLQVEHEQIQKRTFTNWINAQLAKRRSPSYVSDLFSDLRDGSRLLDLLEVMSGQSMKRQRGRGVFQQRANVETALDFLKKKSIKLVNINIPDITDGRPSIILGLVWTIILHCHIEELASALSFSSRHSSLDSVSSLDSWSGSPVPASLVPAGRVSPLHRRFRVSAKKALLMWVRDQCKKVHCTVNVKDFKSSWRSGEAFLAILCSLRPELVDLCRVQTRSNQENLEEAFHLAERELHIPRLLEPQDVDVRDPDEKSIMTYVAQFLQYSNDLPAPDDHLQLFPLEQPSGFSPECLHAHVTPAAAFTPSHPASPSERVQDATRWLQQACQELSETWTAAEGSNYAEKYQVYESLTASFADQRRSVMKLLAAARRRSELNQEQEALRTAWDQLEDELRRCEADLEQSLPPPLDSVVSWLQRGEAALKDEAETTESHAEAAKHARAKQDQLKTLIKEMNHYVTLADSFHSVDDSGSPAVPSEKLNDIKTRLTGVRVTAKYKIIKLEFEESHHTVLDLLGDVKAKVRSWGPPYGSQQSVQVLLLDWHETVEHRGLLLILTDALQSLKDRMDVYTSKASLGGDSQRVIRQVKEAESESELVKQMTAAAKEMMDRIVSAWDVCNKNLTALETWLMQTSAAETQDMSEWSSCHARLNEAGNFLIEMTEASISSSLVKQLSKVNLQWAERMKKTVFEIESEPKVGPSSALMLDSLTQEASLLLRQPLDVASVPLKAVRQKLQSIRTKIGEVDASANVPSADLQMGQRENLQQTLIELAEAERCCGDLQRAASQLEGRVAELDHWSTEALDCYDQLMERKHRGGQSAAKVLISRGLQLAQQVTAESQHLEAFVAERQKTSPLQTFSTADMQDKTAAAISRSQEILEKFSSCGFKQQVGNFCEWMQPVEILHPDTGSYILARTKQVIDVKLQTPELIQLPDQGARRRQDSKQSTEDRKGSASHVKMKTVPQPVMVPVLQSQTESPAAGSTEIKSRTASQPNTQQGPTHTQPPLMIHSEVHCKAQSMARSRLEKARLRLQGRIQQAMKLFSGREMTESQTKKKQKALNTLQPAMLDEFLGAAEAFGAFCSGPQLQDLMLLSESVRNQWEDVRREMADFISIQASKIREVKQPFTACDIFTNALHDAADQTDHSYLQQHRKALTQEAASVEERSESLRELCETLTVEKSSGSATDQQTEPEKVQKTQIKSRGQQPAVNPPPSPADTQPGCSLAPERRLDAAQQDASPSGKAARAQRADDALRLRVWDVPPGNKDHLRQSQGDGREKKQKPSLRAQEQLLRAHLLHITGSGQQAHSHVQAVVRSNTVESKQEAEWTVIPEPDVPPQLERATKRDAAGSRMVPLKSPSDPMESAVDQTTIITEKLNQIISQPLDVSSLALDECSLFSDLKEVDETLKDEMRRLSEEEQRGPAATSQPFLRQSLLLGNVRHLEQLRRQLDGVQSAVETLDHFLATLRDIKAESPTLLTNRDPNERKNETELLKERHSWQATVERLKLALAQSHVVDCSLKAAGMTLTMDGASVTCRDVAAFLSDQMRAKRREGEKDLDILEKNGVESSEDVEEPRFAPVVTDEESTLEFKRRKQEPKIQISASEEGFLQRSPSGHAGKAGNERKGLVQRRSALLAVLRETKAAAERLELLEPTLPALQQRTRALTELESFLAGLDSEVQYVHDASSESDFPKENQSREVEDLWEETRKATSERLEQAQALTELLRRFQIMRGELSGTLQTAEATLGEQASYVGKDYLQRLYAKVGETKAELNGLGDDIEEVRSVCRQLQSLLRQVPGCSGSPFENEADALMDRWLDLSERTDSHLENLHLCLTLWDGVLQLGQEVVSWTNSRTAALSQGPSFQTEDHIKALQNEIMTQEESARRFHRKAAEIQSLLQSAEPPLELQVVETQMRKKIEQLKELLLESEEVYKQTVATMGQITERMTESLSSLQKIQDSLRSFSAPDVATVLAKLKELCRQLHTEDEQAQSLLEDVQVLASIAGPDSLHSLSVRGIQLEEKLRNTHQLFAEVEEQTERNVQHLDRLQTEKEQLEKWLCAAEEEALKTKNLSFLQEEAIQQRGRSERIAELVSSLRSSNLQHCVLLQQSCDLLQQCQNFCTNLGGVSEEATPRPSNNSEAFQGLVESIQSWFDDLRQSDRGEEIKTSAEQRLRHAQAVLKATTGAETRLEQLRATGESLSQRLSPDLKRDVQVKIQKTQQDWKNLLESVQPYSRALEDDLELSSAYLTSRQEASCRVEELKHQAERLPSLFPWPGSAERAQACLLARQLQAESESLKLTLTSLDEKRMELAEKTRNAIWKDSSWDELETRWAGLTAEVKGLCAHLQKGLSKEEELGQLLQACHHHLTTLQQRMTACQPRAESSGGLTFDAAALEALLKQVTEIEKELLVLVTLRDSLAASCTAEAQASLSEQISNLQNHKRAIERAIPLQGEASLLQADLRDLGKNVEELSVLPDVFQLTQQWRSVQEWDNRLTQLDIRANGLQRTRETQEVLPAEAIFTVSAVWKELLSLRSVFNQKKEECVAVTGEAVRGVIRDLQLWIQAAEVQTSPGQAVLDEGLQLQNKLYDVLSQQNILVNCLGEEMMKTLLKSASEVLLESRGLINQMQTEMPNGGEEKAGDVCEPNSDRHQDGRETLHVPTKLLSSQPGVLKNETDANKPNPENIPVICATAALDDIPAVCSESPDVFGSKEPPSASGETNQQIAVESTDMTVSGNIAGTIISASLNTEEALVLDPSYSDKINKIKLPVVSSPKESTEATIPGINNVPDPSPIHSERLDALEDHSDVSTEVCLVEPEMEKEKTEKELIENTEKATRFSTDSAQSESDQTPSETCIKSAKSEAFSAGAREQDEQNGQVNGSKDKVFTVVLELQSFDIQPSGYVGDQQCKTSSNAGFPEKKPRPNPELDGKPAEQKGSSRQSENKETQPTHAVKNDEALTLSESDSKCEFETAQTSPVSKSGATACHSLGETAPPALSSAEDLVPNRDETETENQIDATDKQLTAADSAMSPGGAGEGAARGGANDSECTHGKHCPTGQDGTSLLPEEKKWKQDGALKEMLWPLGKLQSQRVMESERIPPGSACGPGAEESTGGSPGSHSYSSALQDSLSAIQASLEQSNILQKMPHMDLSWYLTSSPGDADVRLARTVQRVLACRYQPARLSAAAMDKQLQEAQEYRRSVQEQVASIKSNVTTVSDPKASERAEAEWSSALLDASATVQVKAAQLDLVKQYHLQKKNARAFLEVVAAEKEKMSLSVLGSSSLQEEKLSALLLTMEQKKSTLEGLLCLSSQLSVHLSDAESSGVLVAQLGDIQEEWRLLKGSIRRAHQQASNSASQSKLVLKEAAELKAKLEALLKSETDNISCLDLACLTTELKVCNQLLLHLQSQAGSLICFSLGQKEKAAIEEKIQDLKTLLRVTKEKLNSLPEICGSGSTSKINKQLQDLINLTKQAENRVFSGKKLSVFPEQARLQFEEMREFHMETLSRRSKMQMQVGELKGKATETENQELIKTVELYETVADRLGRVLEAMKKGLDETGKVMCEFGRLDVWVAETYMKRETCTNVENVSKADLSELEMELKSHRSAAVELETQLKLVDALSESCTKLAVELSPAESRYLGNRLLGLWAELDGLLAHEKATCWELEELIHERMSSKEGLAAIQANLEQTFADLEKQKFPLTKETLLVITQLEHKLMEHQWEVQELQHCQEDQRNSVLCAISELQDQCKALRINAMEQQRYVHHRGQMEESMKIAQTQLQEAKNQSVSAAERFRLIQTLLVELAMVNTQCQETADHLEAIARELEPSELNAEKKKLHDMVETLICWEQSATDQIKNLEAELLPGLHFEFELPALMDLLQRANRQLEENKQVKPDEKAIDDAVIQCWVIRRNVESGMRVLAGLAQRDNVNLEDCNELNSLRDAVMQQSNSWMVGLSQARESLKDYQWAAQGAINFLHNAEATFLSAPGGFLDCTQEQRQTQQALEALEVGFQAHISHLMERVPQERCLSRPETELLHINVLSQLLVGRAVLESQAKLRVERLQRCEVRQRTHRKWHEDVKQEVLQFEAKLSGYASEKVTSYDECIDQQKRVKVLKEDLRDLAGKMVDLRAGCPTQGCGVGKDGEHGALWRGWMSLRRRLGLLLVQTEQKEEEWKDITTSMEESCSCLSGLQAELPDSSTVSFSQEEPQELLAQMEQQQLALSSLKRRLEDALGSSSSQDGVLPGSAGKSLEKIQESIWSLKERYLLLMAAAEEEEEERRRAEEEIRDVEKKVFEILPELETSSDPSKTQELQENVISLKTQLKHILDALGSRHAEIPPDIRTKIQNVEQSVQKAEEMQLLETDNPIRKLSRRVRELGSGLERVKSLLEQKSPTIREAQRVLKCVWDELDAWHSSLMLLDSEVQDVAEDQPDEAQLLMDQLTEPLQLYQNASRLAENRTAFLNKIPACLQEFEDISHRASCWLDEAQLWLGTQCNFTTAKSLSNHVKYLQLMLEDSDRIRHTLQVFKSGLVEISAVCDVSAQEERLDQRDQQVQEMQQTIVEPLDQLQEAAAIVEVVEADIKAMEKNVSKFINVLNCMDDADVTQAEREEILTQIQLMQKSLEDMESWKEEVHLPEGAENLVIFSKARMLLEQLDGLEQITREKRCLLENKKEEEETTENLNIISDSSEEMPLLENPAHRRFFQEAFEMHVTEEEEDEGDESRHSSSSDTLTCSIPEDLEETLNLPDEPREDMEEQSAAYQAENGSDEPGIRVLCVKSGLDDSFGPTSPKLDLNASQTFHFEKVENDVKDEDVAGSSEQKTADVDPQINPCLMEAAVGDTRLIPSRPTTPFCSKKASDEPREEEDDRLSSSSADLSHPGVLNKLKEQKEVSPSSEPQKTEASFGSPDDDDDDVENQHWTRIRSHVGKKVSTLRKVLEEQKNTIGPQDGGKKKTVPGKDPVSAGSVSSVLQQIKDTNAKLRQTLHEAKASGSSHPGVKKKFGEAVQSVVTCLDSSADLLTPDGPAAADPQLRLLQLESLWAQLEPLAELVAEVEAQIKLALLMGESDAHSGLVPLDDFAQTVQLLLTSSHSQLLERSGLQSQHQTLPPCRPRLLDPFDAGLCEIFPNLKGPLSLECEPGGTEEAQHASQTLLQGISRLLKRCEESLTEKRTSLFPSRSKLQADLCRREKLLQVLGSQLSFLQYLFQHEPDALSSKQDEWVHLEVRAKALQQQLLEQQVASQKTLQDWTHWEQLCGQLGSVLDESEAFFSAGEPEGDDEEETVQRRLHACERTLIRLEESRSVLGSFLDHRLVLQAELWFGASVAQEGGALELRWKGAYRRMEQEILRLRNIQESRARFLAGVAAVGERLLAAGEHLKTSSDLSQESVQRRLLELLDVSVELTAVSKETSRLVHLRDAKCPKLTSQVSQLEASCSQLTSALSKMLEHLLQRLVNQQPPVKLLSEVENWLKETETRLSRETKRVLTARTAAEMVEILQQCQALRTAVDNCQQVLDFMSEPGSKMAGADVPARRLERTTFAENLGGVRQQWELLQRELDGQIHEVEHIHHICAERERHLQKRQDWTEQQKKRMSQWKRPCSQTLAGYALLEWEAEVARIQQVSADLQDLGEGRGRGGRVCYGKEGKLLWEEIFSGRVESVRRDCVDLHQQMEDLRADLEQSVEKWSCFRGALGDVALLTTRVRCALQQQQLAPLFSLQQAEGKSDRLQELQVKAEEDGEQLWTDVDKSCRTLMETLHDASAQLVRDEVEEQRNGWKKILQEIKEEHKNTREIFSLWLEYANLSERFSLRLQHLRNEWEELSGSSSNDAETTVCCVKKLQDAADELQSDAGDVLAASKALLGRLKPSSANLIKSEARLLSRDFLLLNQAILGKRRNLEEDLERERRFKAQLEALEEQMQSSLFKLHGGACDADTLEQVLLDLSDMTPSLVDVKETSGDITLSNEEMERVQSLSRLWAETVTKATDENKVLQDELQSGCDFEEKCEKVKMIQEHLQRESLCRKDLSHSSLKEMLAVHQKLQVEVMKGHQLLQSLLCDALSFMEKQTEDKRSELTVRVACLKRSWSDSVALAAHDWTSTKEHLQQWRIYQHGLKSLKKLFREVDSLLPPSGPDLHTVQQLQNVSELIEESLGLHSSVYARTVEAGKHLCEIITESESRTQLQSELQDLQKVWERTTLLQRKNKDLLNNTVQMQSQNQEAASSISSGLEKVDNLLAERPADSEEEAHIQEAELSLQRLAGGLRELATMKTDLSQYVAASDSVLLEQQLEMLHAQWEELCTKVSLRRQEIADRLNAWTIFNDKNKEFCDWLTQMENKVCHSAELSIEEMVEKLKKDCMEEINLFSENKSHLKQLGEQLLLASDQAKQTQVRGSLQEVNQRWNNLFQHIEARVRKLKETLVTLQQLDKNMSNLRSWLSRIEAELSRPITYSVCHENEIQKRLAEQQDLQRDLEQHTEGVASVLSLCDVLLQDEDAAGGSEAESDSLQETSRSLDQRWRTICALALDRRLRIEETWTLWCKFLNDYSRFDDWLKMAERTAANPNSADVLYSAAKEELKKFEGFQRQVHERLTQLELINNQYRRLARENRTDRASQLKAMVREGNQRWDGLHRRVAAILRRLKYFTSQREDFEGTRESMLVWLTELDLQLTNVEHFSESDVHQKIQQLNSFQKEISLNTERIDGLIVFGEALIQKSSAQDAALIEDELEELHSYCQEVFSRLVRFHQRLSQPPMIREEPDLSDLTVSLESSLELIGRPWLGRSQTSLPATPTHLLGSLLDRSGRETPVSVDSLPLEWDHTGDVGGSSSHEDEEEEEEQEDEGAYFSAHSVSSLSLAVRDCSWRTTEAQPDPEGHAEPTPALTSTPLKQGYLRLMSQCSGSIENIKRVSLILDDDEEQPEEFGLTGLNASDKQSGVIERWELLRAQSRCSQQSGTLDPQQMTFDLDDLTSWLETVIPELERLSQSEPAGGIEDMESRAKELKEMEKAFCHYKAIMLSVNLQAKEAPETQDRVARANRDWSRACTGLQRWDHSLRRKLIRCQEFHETLQSLLLWLAQAESRCYSVDVKHPETSVGALRRQEDRLTELQADLRSRQAHQASLQALWSQLQPEDAAEDCDEAQEKLHVTGTKLKQLRRKVEDDLRALQQRLLLQDPGSAEADTKTASSTLRCRRESSPPRSFFSRLLRAAFPLQLLLLLLLLLPCLIPLSDSEPGCTLTNNFAWSFYPMLHYTNGPPPT